MKTTIGQAIYLFDAPVKKVGIFENGKVEELKILSPAEFAALRSKDGRPSNYTFMKSEESGAYEISLWPTPDAELEIAVLLDEEGAKELLVKGLERENDQLEKAINNPDANLEPKPGIQRLASLLAETVDESAKVEKLSAGDVYTALAYVLAYAVKANTKGVAEIKRDLIEIKKAAMKMAGV